MFFDDSGISKRGTFPLREGYYSLTIYHLGRDSSEIPAVGLFGSDRWPRIIFVFRPNHTRPTMLPDRAPNIIRLNTTHWVTEPITGALCVATITKVSDGSATLQLHLTSSTRSGYGRMPLPARMNNKPNQDVVVRLGINEGAYWSAEFVSKA